MGARQAAISESGRLDESFGQNRATVLIEFIEWVYEFT